MKNKILIIGAGDLGKQIDHFITNYSKDRVIGWLDDTKDKGEKVNGKTVFGEIDDFELVNRSLFDCIAVAIGYNHLRFKCDLIEKLKNLSVSLYTFIHPTAYVDCTAVLNSSIFIYPNVTIDQKTLIGDGVIINNNAVISHDSEIGANTFIAPSSTIAGNVSVGKNCFIGIGCIIGDSVSICDEVRLGAGTIVLNDILQPGKYVDGPKLRKIE